MNRKRLICSILCSSLLLLNGCGLQKTLSEPLAEVQEISEQPADETSEALNLVTITDEDMKKFFASYLTIDEESIMMLNQKPKNINEQYWQAYDDYKTKTKQILSNYLSQDAKARLDKQYIHDDFHYPRFLEINDYMITRFSSVEDAVIISKQIKNDHVIYEVMVTVMAKVIDLDEANVKYRWDQSKGYYTSNISVESDDTVSNPDHIKVNLKYLIETTPGENFVINSVKENTGVYLGTDQQAKAGNNSFVARIPYTDKVADKDKEMISKFLEAFMKQEYSFYNYYRKAYNTNFDMVEIALVSDLRLRGVINLKQNYQFQFNPLIIPVKDDILFLDFDAQEDVAIATHISSTKNHPAYQVSFIAEAVLVNGTVKSYEYTYLFVFEDDMILSVNFINQKEIAPGNSIK